MRGTRKGERDSGDEGTVEEERVGIRFDELEGPVGIANGTNWCTKSRPGGSVLHGLVTQTPMDSWRHTSTHVRPHLHLVTHDGTSRSS
jgi:hypothetical protein